ncbi:MAG: ABC transporter ATP-binding protein [Alphaproteobacteria bacterium]|nr:ABC transporter ATP-binding protein [Alphaproteobacteria bacterium]
MTEADAALPADTILRIAGLKTYFRSGAHTVRAVDGVDLTVKRGETLALVGESGSGKSVASLSVMRLVPDPPGRIVAGAMLFRGPGGDTVDLAQLPAAAMRRIRGRAISMIFQEPMTSLNPVFSVGEQIAESIMLHEGKSRADALADAVRLLDMVEIPAAASRVKDYPHQMSGGMRQRVMIALALACRPALLIADEPTTALDVTIQAQILALMQRLQRELGMSILFITHNLGVVAEIAHRVAVMYAGRIVEQGDVRALFAAPRHPYTKGLMQCVPRIGARRRAGARARLPSIPGTIPSAADLPPGCAFAPRCGLAIDACSGDVPPLAEAGPDRASRCLRWREVA